MRQTPVHARRSSSIVNRQVNPRRDQVHVDGNRVFMRPSSEVKWVALNKPKGVICTVSDELGRPTAVSAVPRGQEMRLVPVGRLDRDSCGLLLLTNENSWVSCLVQTRLVSSSHVLVEISRYYVEISLLFKHEVCLFCRLLTVWFFFPLDAAALYLGIVCFAT